MKRFLKISLFCFMLFASISAGTGIGWEWENIIIYLSLASAGFALLWMLFGGAGKKGTGKKYNSSDGEKHHSFDRKHHSSDRGYQNYNKKMHTSLSGYAMRSKSEVIVANILSSFGIKYTYETPLYIRGKRLSPDFTIINNKTNKIFYWEHQGRMGDPDYRERQQKRRKLYNSAVSLVVTLDNNGVIKKERGEKNNNKILIRTMDDDRNGIGISSPQIGELIKKEILGGKSHTMHGESGS